MSKKLPPLDHLRTVLRIGMTRDEFYAACDDLMESYQLRIGSPAVSESLVSIYVEEGDAVLCFMPAGTLSYVEYKGDVFMGG